MVNANWKENPWFPKVLEQERLDCLRDSPEEYDHIWEGGYATVHAGAYFAKLLASAKAQGRIGKVAADPLLPMRAAFKQNAAEWKLRIVTQDRKIRNR